MKNSLFSIGIAFAILGLTAPYGRTQSETPVTLGPGLMTYPEIAQALSTADQPIHCARTLQERAAFLSLKGHSRSQMLELVASGLGVEFAVQNGTMEMSADPKIEKRENRWRRQFLGNLRAALDQSARAYFDLSKRDSTELKREAEQRATEAEKLTESALLSDRLRAARLIVEADRFSTAADPMNATARVGVAWELRYAPTFSTEDAWRTGFVAASYSPDAIGREIVQSAVPEKNLAPYSLLIGGLRTTRSGDSISLSYYTVLSASGEFPVISCNPPLGFLLLPDDVIIKSGEEAPSLIDAVFRGTANRPEPFPGLGTEAIAWLASERMATADFLEKERQHPAPTTPTTGPIPPGDALSGIVARWCQSENREAIMEVFPGIEPMPRGRNAASLLSLLTPHAPWTLRMRSNVLLVQNQLAFLDHGRDIPTAALIRLVWQTRKKPPVAGKRFLEPSNEVITEYAEVAKKHALIGVGTYWGISLDQLNAALPATYLRRTLTASQKEELAKTGHLSLSPISAGRLEEAVSLLRRLAPENTAFWHPDVVNLLRQCELTDKPLISPGTTFLYGIGIELTPAVRARQRGN